MDVTDKMPDELDELIRRVENAAAALRLLAAEHVDVLMQENVSAAQAMGNENVILAQAAERDLMGALKTFQMAAAGWIAKGDEPIPDEAAPPVPEAFPGYLPGEEDAVRQVLHHGATYGYGNMIQRLKEAWRDMLMRRHGMDKALAARAVGLEADHADHAD